MVRSLAFKIRLGVQPTAFMIRLGSFVCSSSTMRMYTHTHLLAPMRVVTLVCCLHYTKLCTCVMFKFVAAPG